MSEVVGDGVGSGSSGVAPSDGGGSAVGGDGAASATPTPAADGRVVPQLDCVDATTTLRSGDGTPVTVTIVPQTSGKSAKRSWVWQVFHQFKPAILEKNVFCQACKHLLKWKPRAGTHGMSEHYKTRHRRLYDEVMKDHTTLAEGRANIAEAIGELLHMYVKCARVFVSFGLF